MYTNLLGFHSNTSEDAAAPCPSPREKPQRVLLSACHAYCYCDAVESHPFANAPLRVGRAAAAQIRNMLSNLTSNERINRKRYPWLNATPRGPPFNHYDLGPWNNLMEFCGIGVDRGGGDSSSDFSDSVSDSVSEKDGGGAVVAGDASFRRHPRDYLKVWLRRALVVSAVPSQKS